MILVTGGNGFVGRSIIRTLLDRGYHPRILTRNPVSPRFGPPPAGVDVVQGDPFDPAVLDAAMDGVKGVIHLVGIISETRKNTFEQVHVELTRQVLLAAERAQVSRYVHMSAINTRPNAPSRYHQTKFAAEQLVRASSLPFTILRPSLIFGPGDGFLSLFLRLMSLPFRQFPLIGDGSTQLQPIFVNDVAAGFVSALANRDTLGTTIDLVGSPITYRDLVLTVGRAAGLQPVFIETPYPTALIDIPLAVLRGARPAVFPVPPLLFRLLAYHWEYLPIPFPALVTNDQITMMLEDQCGDPTPMRQLLGLNPKPLNEALASYLGT
ncbi:MAG: complex I NDUFA9 subunit family protein [Verrucomicrobiia bacterium]